jgi:hypothetical protein
MSRIQAPLLVAALLVAASCGSAVNAEYGGEPEAQLNAATTAGDVDKVTALLAAGANPNKLGRHEGHFKSPWQLATGQLRPRHPERVAIALAMLRAHANPAVAFGETPSIGPPVVYRPTQSTPILDAISGSAPEVVRGLFEAGLDRRHGQLPLVLAVENGDAASVHALVEAGVEVNCQPTGSTPLLAAIEARNVALMTYLEAHGALEKPRKLW